MKRQTDNETNTQNEADADKIFLTEDSTLQSKQESDETAKNNYYKVDEKKLVTTNIGDGTSHDDGLAEAEDNNTPQEDH